MKVALWYLTWQDDDNEYGKSFPVDGCDEWYYPIDSQAKLPVGSCVDMDDPITERGVDFLVMEQHYSVTENLLRLKVETDPNMESFPEDFVRYIQTYWIAGAKIHDYNWAMVPK